MPLETCRQPSWVRGPNDTISCHFRDCKALLVASLTRVSGAITSVQSVSIISRNSAGRCRSRLLLAGFQFIRRLINAKVMKDWSMEMTNRQLGECEQLGNFTEQYIHCHLRYITLSGGSPVGTCRIGAAGDPSAVVDPLLR